MKKMKKIKISHEKFELSKKIKLDLPIKKLKIGSNAECCYENNLSDLKTIYIGFHTYHVDGKRNYDIEKCNILLFDENCVNKPFGAKLLDIYSNSNNSFEIESDQEHTLVNMINSKSLGTIVERYYDGKLGDIDIKLNTSENSISREELLESLKKVFGIKQEIEFRISIDEDVDRTFLEMPIPNGGIQMR